MKILIVRVGRMGDMVMTTPALTALLKKYPGAEFTLLTSPDGKRTLSDFNPRIATFWIYDRSHPLSFFTGRSIKKKIKEALFAHIYCFEHNPSYHRLFLESDAVLHRIGPKKALHYCELLLDVVSEGESRHREKSYVTLPLQAEAKRSARQYLTEQGITEEVFLLAMHPTFSGASKSLRPKKYAKHKLWPPESFAELAMRLQKYGQNHDVDIKIVMNLMPEELAYGKQIAALGRSAITILSPKPNFQKYKAFLQRANLLVAADTGPMHIAAALGTDVIALFSGKDPGDCGPFAPQEQVKVFRAEETTRPEMGIAAISVDDIYDACLKNIRKSA